MLTIKITNSSQTPRTWYAEPYGDEVAIGPGGLLEIDVPSVDEIVVEIEVHDDGQSICPMVHGPETAITEGLRLNGKSLWPEA